MCVANHRQLVVILQRICIIMNKISKPKAMKIKSILLFALFASSALFFAGCNKHETASTKPKTMDDLKVPSSFDWSMTKDVTLNISMNLPSVTTLYNDVRVYGGDPSNGGSMLFQGWVGNNSPLAAKIRTVSGMTQLYLVLSPVGGVAQTAIVPISENISYTFVPQTKSMLKLAGPDCSGATPSKTLSGSGTVKIDDGSTWYITGTCSKNITIEDGTTLIICGTFTGSLDIGKNNTDQSYVKVSTTGVIGSASVPVTVQVEKDGTFQNWGTVHIAGNFVPNDQVENYGTMTVYGQYNMNGSQGDFINGGGAYLAINSHWNVINECTNLGTIEVFGDMNCNNSEFLNSCALIVHGNYHLNNCEFTNQTGYIKCYEEAYMQGGTGFMKLYDGSMISTKDFRVNADVQGFGSKNTIRVTDQFRFDGPKVITGPIEATQTTGTLAAGGPSNFTNGATFVSFANITNIILPSACNPEGNQPPSPGNVTSGTIVFEDLWPGKGDYDFNDLVLYFKSTMTTNFQNKVTDLQIKLYVRAAGASFENGFGIQFDGLVPGDIASVTGGDLQYSYITLSANGTEAGQAKAVIIPWDNWKNVVNMVTPMFFNTVPGAPVGTADTITMNIHFTSPVTTAALGTAPFNSFIIRNMERVAEIHLPNYVPTTLAENCPYFGTMEDATNPALGKYYVTSNNLPWALNIPEQFDYPWEKVSIIDAYNYFATWAESGGAQYPTWYKDLPGYRNAANIWHP
jgi:LruC domain-containing protein